MKMEPIVSSETSAIRTQTPGNYPKRNNLHLEQGESLRTSDFNCFTVKFYVSALVGVIIKVILQNALCNNKDKLICCFNMLTLRKATGYEMLLCQQVVTQVSRYA